VFLPEFSLLAISTTAGIAAAFGIGMLAMASPRFGVARWLFWIFAIAFWSLGVVWSSTTSEQPLLIQMLVSAAVGAVSAGALSWGLYEIRSHERSVNIEPNKAKIETPERPPTLEATRSSTIDASHAIIPGDLPFQFGKADDHSVIAMPGTTVTRKNDGTILVTPGSTPTSFPPPTGEFSSSSNSSLNVRAQKLSAELRELQARADEDFKKLKRNESGGIGDADFKALIDPYASEYRTKLAPEALSLASEFLNRLGSVTPTTFSVGNGAQMILYKTFAGPRPASDAADFLDYLRQRLPN
jgi:hypothetical protein